MAKIKRGNRFDPHQRTTKKLGIPKTYRITPLVLSILKSLQLAPYQMTRFISAEHGYTKDHIQRLLLKIASSKGDKKLLRRSPKAEQSLHKDLVYELTKYGENALEENGFLIEHPRDKSPYDHELVTGMVMAGIKHGVNELDNVELHDWYDLVDYEKMPKTTKFSDSPFKYPYVLNGVEKYLYPDFTPFVLWYEADGKRKPMCIASLEIDMATEANSPKNYMSRANLKKKFLAYLYLNKTKFFKKHFGFPNWLFLFVTTSETRTENHMKLLLELTNGKGATNILFHTAENPRYMNKTPNPFNYMTEWKRAGHPPIDLSNPWG